MTSLKTSIKTITYLSDTGCLEIQGASLMMFSSMASGHDAGGLQSPACGVVCDPYICVNSDGISPELTRKYLGEKAAENLQSLQGYDPSEFTFANGVFCDVKEKLYRDDRYFGVDGKRSGKINQTTTKMLFMCRE